MTEQGGLGFAGEETLETVSCGKVAGALALPHCAYSSGHYRKPQLWDLHYLLYHVHLSISLLEHHRMPIS